jgi:hypothetical protein
VSERKPNPRGMEPKKGPPPIPVARGVAPPPKPGANVPASPAPKPVARRPAPPPLPRAKPRSAAAPEFNFGDNNGKVVLRRSGRKPKNNGVNWSMLAAETGAAVVLAACCMVAGWWFLGRTPPAPVVQVKAESSKPPVVVEPPKPVEKPAAVVVPPPPVKEPPKLVEKPIEKPVEPPAKPPVAEAPVAPKPAKPATPAVTNLTFQRDILPILKNKCIGCHGENKKKLKGGLDVSTLAALLKGGDSGPAINRADPETSPLWETVASGQMPPGKSTKMDASEKKKLHDWIVGGGK